MQRWGVVLCAAGGALLAGATEWVEFGAGSALFIAEGMVEGLVIGWFLVGRLQVGAAIAAGVGGGLVYGLFLGGGAQGGGGNRGGSGRFPPPVAGPDRPFGGGRWGTWTTL